MQEKKRKSEAKESLFVIIAKQTGKGICCSNNVTSHPH